MTSSYWYWLLGTNSSFKNSIRYTKPSYRFHL